MKIVKEFPPNIEAIRAKFPLKGSEIFCWGDIIYSPSTDRLPTWLIMHESVHTRQQKEIGGTEIWWERYLKDTKFRFEQELEAHQVEYRSFCELARERVRRRIYLKIVARKLASPMYGRMVTFEKAKKLIKKPPIRGKKI